MTRVSRGDDQEAIYYFGPAQRTPRNFEALLKSSSFKTEFLHFFYEGIQQQEYAHLIGRKVLYCAIDNECVMLKCENSTLKCVIDLYDEADTQLAFHAISSTQ